MKSGMSNDVLLFTPVVQSLLDKYGPCTLPLTAGESASVPEAKLLKETAAETLFPEARNPQASVSGLLLLLNQWEESHNISQTVDTVDGSYWHGIAHRMEPDAFNAAYWFRRVRTHAIFPELRRHAADILSESPNLPWRLKADWDPLLFIDWCEQARQQPGGRGEHVALAIQKAEWQLLFQWCSQAPR